MNGIFANIFYHRLKASQPFILNDFKRSDGHMGLELMLVIRLLEGVEW